MLEDTQCGGLPLARSLGIADEVREVAFLPDREHGRVDIGIAANGGRVGQSGGYLCDYLGARGGDRAVVDFAVRAHGQRLVGNQAQGDERATPGSKILRGE